MYYYSSSNNDSSVGLGIPSDNPYSLNLSMAVGRIIAFDDIDASLLIARSVFYNDVIHGAWRKRFVFIFGEGFGETGGIFHQLPYSKIVKSMGFDVSIYGDFRNDRHSLEKIMHSMQVILNTKVMETGSGCFQISIQIITAMSIQHMQKIMK